MKINQFKNLRNNITSLKIGSNNKKQYKPQSKNSTHTYQKNIYMRNRLKLRK